MTADLIQKQLDLKKVEKVCGNLMRPESFEFRTTIIYLVYETIRNNPGITVAQLVWMLNVNYFLTEESVTAAVAQLCSATGFDTVTRWSNPGTQGKVVVLSAKEPSPTHFSIWLDDATSTLPELLSIVPPAYQKRAQKPLKS